MNRDHILGIDIGGSFIKSGLVATDGRVQKQFPPVPTGTGEEVRKTVLEIAKKRINQHPFRAVGISTCGVVNPGSGEVLENTTIAGYAGTDWKRVLAPLGVPVAVENDARAAAWAEFCLRKNRRIQEWMHLPLGTSISSGIIIQGKIWYGSSFSAGEIGHITAKTDGPVCSCGNIGCLEGLVSRRMAARYLLDEISKGVPSLHFNLEMDPDAITIHQISAAEKAGDQAAAGAFRQLGKYLGVGLTTAANLINPPVITVGGGILEASDTILATAREYVWRHALQSARKNLEIRKGQLGNRAGFTGAALLAADLSA
jgi:glucokinase